MNDLDFFTKVLVIIKRFQPKATLKSKNKMWQHRLLGKIFPKYMDFSTTIGWTIAIARKHVPNWNVLAHEGVHILQAKRQTRIIHSLLYVMPQILGVLGIVLPLILWNSWFLLFLLFALPIPAYFRMMKELEAYQLSVVLRQWRYGKVEDKHYDYYVSNFTGLNYYFMWPFKEYIRDRLEAAVFRAQVWGPINEYERQIYDAMKEHGMLYKKVTI